jgi:tetratricopeptide (TPR) repeat protein
MKFEFEEIEFGGLHEALQPIARMWIGGKPANAYNLLQMDFRKATEPVDLATVTSPDDWLFIADLFNSCGMFEESKCLTRRGLALHPESLMLRLLHTWDLAADGKFYACQKMLSGLQKGADPLLQHRLRAVDCYNYSIAGWRVSAERAAKRASECASDDPLALYILSRAAARRSDWQLANQLGEQVVALAPHWSRARATWVDSLVAHGQTDRARQTLAETPADARPFYSLEFSHALLDQATGDYDKAIDTMKMLAQRWPLRSRYHRFAAYQLALLLMERNRDAEAAKVASQFRLKRLNVKRLEGVDAKCFIHVPLVAQNHNHCVPTVAAMVASVQGFDAKPAEFAVGMRTRAGTPMWRMVDYMKLLGFRAACVRNEISVIEKLLDNGVPLIGTMNGLFSSHVDVICGYDRGLQLLHVRDPMHWFGRSLPYESVSAKYDNNEGLWALIAPSKISSIDVPDEWLNRSGQAMIDLNRACTLGKRIEAEKAYAGIDDEDENAYSRDAIARCVVITPKVYDDKVKRWAQISDKMTTTQIRAVLSQMNSTNAKEISDLMETKRERFGSGFVDFVQSQCLMALNDWNAAELRLRKVREDVPQLESVWSLCTDVYEQLGDLQQAILCNEVALDISPDNLRLNRRRVDLESLQIPYSDKLKRAVEICNAEPDRPDSCYMLADMMQDGEDGLEYEGILKKCVQYFPRDPWGYNQLASWYLAQSRKDLAGKILVQGRELIGIDELPKWDFELTEEEKAKASEAATGDGETPQASTAADAEANKPTGPVTEWTPRQLLDGCRELPPPDLSLETPLAEPVVDELKRREANLELSWNDAVLFRAWLLDRALKSFVHATVSRQKCVDLFAQAIPPDNVPGVPEIYARALFGFINTYSIEHDAAKLLINWLDRMCPKSDDHPNLAFEKAYLLERIGQLNRSEELLRSILKKSPAYAPSWYRVGIICMSRGNYSEAYSSLKRAVEITPNNIGALSELSQLADQVAPKEKRKWLEAVARTLPYSSYRCFMVAHHVASESKDCDAGLAYLDSHLRLMTQHEIDVMKARLMADFEEYDRAMELITKVSVNEDNEFMINWLHIDAKVANRDFEGVLPILETMLAKNPENGDIADQLARVLRELSLDRAKDFCREQFAKGANLPLFSAVLIAKEKDPAQVAIQTVMIAPEKDKIAVAESFSIMLNDASTMPSLMKFLDWAIGALPFAVELHETYIVRLSMQRKDKPALEAAKRLLERFPDQPRWSRLVGIVIQDSDPKGSIAYLQREFDATGNADTLTRIARGHQLVGDLTSARKCYMQALEINPADSLAITNLYFKFQEKSPQLFENAVTALERGAGIDDQYFLIVVMKMAQHLRKTVPESWIRLAIRRLEMVHAEGGFQDEHKVLPMAITAWMSKRPADVQLLTKPPSLFSRMQAKLFGPGINWVPAQASAA